MQHDEHKVGRRGFVGAVAAAAGGLATLGLARKALGRAALVGGGVASQDGAGAITTDATDQGGRDRFMTLAVGDRVGAWRIAAIHATRVGAAAFVLEGSDGRRFQLDVLRRDEATVGVAGTARLSVFVANRGNGRKTTDEGQGLGAIALAARLGELEAQGVAVPTLLTQAQRRARHPLGAYSVPLR